MDKTGISEENHNPAGSRLLDIAVSSTRRYTQTWDK
jgi:hypothetical protein